MQSLRWKSGRFFDIRERKTKNIQFLQKKIKNMEDSLLDKRETMWYNNKAVARGKAALRNSKEHVNRTRKAEEHRCREQGAAKWKGRKLNESLDVRERKRRLYAFRWGCRAKIDGKNRKRFQFTIYLLDKIEEMWYNKEVAAEKWEFRRCDEENRVWQNFMKC